MAEEPAENISGGPSGGGAAAAFDAGSADTRAEAVVNRLGELYWQKTYGGRDAFECLVRTILSQNTSDVASQPAHDALMARYGGEPSGEPGPDEAYGGTRDGDGDGDLVVALADADVDGLAATIESAGLYNQKARRIVAIAEETCDEFDGEAGFDAFVREGDPAAVRERLLDFGGVGPKTADCVLLFAGGRAGVFPVDTHVHRVYRRLGVAPPDADHEAVREVLEDQVPPEKCGFGHTATIQFGREHCSARKPACLDGPEACPLHDLCDRVGVDPDGDTVVDPAETAE